MLPANCDVAIVGAGPAGAATALGLHRLAPSLSVALLDADVRQRPLIEEALGLEVRPVLERLGLWEAFLATEPRASQGVLAAWGDSRLVARPLPFARPGWRVARPGLAHLLHDEARRRGVAVARETRLVDVDARDDGGWGLSLEAGGEKRALAARFVVDASGRRAAVARRLGARKVRFDRLVAAIVVASHPAALGLDADALVEAQELGFWYLAPCSDGALMAAFVTDADLAREHRLGEETAWHAAFQASAAGRCCQERLGGGPGGPPSIRALDCHALDLVAGEGWLAVGSAAASPDFLSSQGLVDALEAGARAAAAITAQLAGRTSGLRRYQAHAGRWLESHLESRRTTYGAERRWEDAAFWARRQDRASVGPDQLLSFTETAANRIRLEGLGMHLPVDQLQLLCSLCVAPRLAQAVVGAFRQRHRSAGPPPPEWRVLAALRFLVDQGLITAE
jgi:flavin-dependent dehydrogenase